jgi:hypothetical protein
MPPKLLRNLFTFAGETDCFIRSAPDECSGWKIAAIVIRYCLDVQRRANMAEPSSWRRAIVVFEGQDRCMAFLLTELSLSRRSERRSHSIYSIDESFVRARNKCHLQSVTSACRCAMSVFCQKISYKRTGGEQDAVRISFRGHRASDAGKPMSDYMPSSLHKAPAGTRADVGRAQSRRVTNSSESIAPDIRRGHSYRTFADDIRRLAIFVAHCGAPMTLSYGRCNVTLGRAAMHPIWSLSTG